MNVPVETIDRLKSRLIAAVFGIHLLYGIVLVLTNPGMADPQQMQRVAGGLGGSALNIVYQVAVLLLCFGWLGLDSRALGIRRPWWLNLGVILLTAVFVPYYLYKTRPAGQRGTAIFSFFGIVFGAAIAMVIGLYLGLMFSGGPAAPASGGL